MHSKDLLIRFILGGGAVAISYLVTVLSPWEILAGIFAAFPAVMITAVLMVGISAGSQHAAKIAKGSVYGMIGCAICVITVWTSLKITGNWMLSIILGLILWLISSIFVSNVREKIGALSSQRQTKGVLEQQVSLNHSKKKSVS
ncbi:DUF3147 family protein [Niallia sp. Krafla_26]|uniref:DUF3147 family protein n=1 Tax=Niallia sp. Krafla_26 TaxID=3064703 RepID=UPI003D17E49B